MKTFYIETFGCQMNVHDSEKVVGTLLSPGLHARWRTPEASRPGAVQHLQHPRQGRAEGLQPAAAVQARGGQGQDLRRAGMRGAAGGSKIFDKAPHVSLVCGSASYTRLAGDCWCSSKRASGASPASSLDTDETFETPFTRRDNPHRAYITIIEGCDKSCAYCVVPFTRGPERSRTSESVMEEARRLAGPGLYRNPVARAEREQLPRPLARAGGISRHCWRASPRCKASRRVRFTTSHPRDFVQGHRRRDRREPGVCESRPPAGAVWFHPRAGAHAAAVHARGIHASASGG